MNTYRRKRNLMFALILVWLIMFSLQGAGILGATVEPIILGVPFSVTYMLVMGIWGVLNTLLSVKLLSPYFDLKVENLIRED
ncbi:hypothetical protein [uncultured Desulfuromusa sp.]|uniref:hypothetical protein n=1 Tax=uncultured Desulfuromusa sp. TaxID=219183 RepID=UPI002AA821C9|nr:hypothetical protein [uncultured Desulfuromusa sp.]